MRFWVTVEDHDAEVEFHAQGDRLWLEVEGHRLEADFRPLPDGEVYSLIIEGRSHEVRVTPCASGVEVTLDGATVPVEVRHPLEKLLQSSQETRPRSVGEMVVAPMPGVVVAVRVRVGERVAPGQPVAVVEAMKMQNELASVRGGVVTEVGVTERETVSAGQPLVRLAPVAGG
jgi:propionyl-CoA carboxylase alpha chain